MDASLSAFSDESKISDFESNDSKKIGKNVRFNDSIDICYIEISIEEKEFKKGTKSSKNIISAISKKINFADFCPPGTDPRKIIEDREKKFGTSFVKNSSQMPCVSPPNFQRASFGQQTFSSNNFSTSNPNKRKHQQSTSTFSSSNPTIAVQRQQIFNNNYNSNMFKTSKSSNIKNGCIPNNQYPPNDFRASGFQSSFNSSFSGIGIKYHA